MLYAPLRRRTTLVITVASSLILAALFATVAGAQNGAKDYHTQAKKYDLTGTWLLTITPDDPGATPFPGLYTFTSDGIALFSSVGPPIPGLGNPGHGVWVRTGQNTFIVKWKQFTFDDILTTNGSLEITSMITLTGADESREHARRHVEIIV